MALEKILKNSSGVPTGEYERIAGGTLYADNPLGTILPFGSATIPSGWLLCDGTAISRTTYSELFAVIGTAFGSGDGSTTFNLPDLRGEFLRGAGTNSHTNQGDGGSVGEHQDATQFPQIKTPNNGTLEAPYQSNITRYDKQIPTSANRITLTGTKVTETTYDYTARPTNTSVNYIIKAKMVALPADFMSAVEEAVEEAFGSDWNTITDVSAPTYFASVNLKYKKIGNILFVHGKAAFNAVTIPSDSYDVLIATLPSGYRPKSAIRNITNIENGFSVISPQIQIEFSTNGKLMVYTSENITLGASGKPISFQFVVES